MHNAKIANKQCSKSWNSLSLALSYHISCLWLKKAETCHCSKFKYVVRTMMWQPTTAVFLVGVHVFRRHLLCSFQLTAFALLWSGMWKPWVSAMTSTNEKVVANRIYEPDDKSLLHAPVGWDTHNFREVIAPRSAEICRHLSVWLQQFSYTHNLMLDDLRAVANGKA